METYTEGRNTPFVVTRPSLTNIEIALRILELFWARSEDRGKVFILKFVEALAFQNGKVVGRMLTWTKRCQPRLHNNFKALISSVEGYVQHCSETMGTNELELTRKDLVNWVNNHWISE